MLRVTAKSGENSLCLYKWPLQNTSSHVIFVLKLKKKNISIRAALEPAHLFTVAYNCTLVSTFLSFVDIIYQLYFNFI